MTTSQKQTQQAYSRTTDDTQAVLMSINLLNLDKLSVPLQLLARARYHLSVIDDELVHTNRDNLLNRGKIGLFAANLNAELEQIPLVFFNYKYDLKELGEALPKMVKQLYDSLYDDELRLKGLKPIAKQTRDIHEHLDRICLLSIYSQVGSN